MLRKRNISSEGWHKLFWKPISPCISWIMPHFGVSWRNSRILNVPMSPLLEMFMWKVFIQKRWLNCIRLWIISTSTLYSTKQQTAGIEWFLTSWLVYWQTARQPTPYLCSTIFLKKSCCCCNATVTQTLLTGLQQLYPNGIQYSNVLLIISDAAPHMVKAITQFTSSIATKAIYLTLSCS